MDKFDQFEESALYDLTREEEMKIAKEVFEENLYQDLEFLGDYLTIEDMVRNTKYKDKYDFKELIENEILPGVDIEGKIKVKKEDFIDWYAEKEKDKTLDDLRWERHVHGH